MEGSSVHFPQVRSEKDGLAFLGGGGDEPAGKGHGLKGGGTACLAMVEKEGLHGLRSVVQIQYILVLKWDRKCQKEKHRLFE